MDRTIRLTLACGCGLALVLTVVIDLAILVVPIYDMQLYDRVLQSRNMDTLAMLSIACVIGLLFYASFDYLRSLTFVGISDVVASRLSAPVFVRSLNAAAGGDTGRCSALVRNMTELQAFLGSGAIAVPLDALCAPMFIAVLFMLHPAFGWLAVVGVAGLIQIGISTEWLAAPGLAQAHEAKAKADSRLVRSLSDEELVRSLGMLPAVARAWCVQYAAVQREVDRSSIRAQMLVGASRLIRTILQAGVMAIGAVLIIRGQTTPGSLMGANLLLNKCLGPFDHLVESCRSWIVARNAWVELGELLLSGGERRTILPASVESNAVGLSVKHLTVATAEGRNLIEDVSLQIDAGTLLLISGANGSGKTTLMRVLAGVTQPTNGSVFLDGKPVQGGPCVGFLPQATALLEGTISENIGRFQPDFAGILEAAKLVGVHDEIGRMADGYNTALYNNGVNLSLGMRQRVGLARALYGNPNLLLLDEPDANLDANSSALMLDAIRKSCSAGAIAIVISHRRSIRDAADRVIELVDGRLSHDSSWPAPADSQLETA